MAPLLPLPSLVPRGELPGTTGFRTVLAPFAALAAARLPGSLPFGPDSRAVVELPAIREEFTLSVVGSLARQAARTLVLELNVARATGRLAGDTPADRFRDFLRLTTGRHGISALLREYPVLARLLARTCLDAAAAMTELLQRFAADRADLVATLLSGVDPGPLVAIRRTAGDGHRRGRNVAVLRFADGAQVVYKPRPLQAHRHFNEVVAWFNTLPGTPGLRSPELLERSGYGWSEFIAARPCVDSGQLERFYLRQGAWLAVMHVLDGTDLHFENVVASADEPVLVDIETLFHPGAPASPARTVEAQDPAVRVLESSVYRTGLLPALLLGDETALDASGLGGDAGARSPVATAEWEAAGTDEMRLVRRFGTLPGAVNRPRLDGGPADADPADHAEELVAGFRAGYQAIAARREELTGPNGLLQRFAHDEVRVVTRATREYATLLDESTHPDVLRDAAERERILRVLETDVLSAPVWPRLVDSEVEELRDGDIPLFTTRPGTSDLWTGPGERLPGVLDRSGLDRAADKIRAMGPDDLGRQEWIIRAALASRSAAPAHQVAEPAPTLSGATLSVSAPSADAPSAPDPDPAQLLAAACGTADQLVDRAHRNRADGDDPGRVNWLVLDLLGDCYWRLGPAAADLGYGYLGPALFLAQLATVTGVARYAEVAHRALTPVPRLLDTLAASPDDPAAVGSGAFAGLGGIAYALTHLAVLLDDSGIRDRIGQAVALTVAAATAEEVSGVAEGTAGGLAALLAVHRATGDADAWRGAELCADRLLGGPFPAAPGFAFGGAGIGWALLRFAQAGGAERFERAGLAALRSAVRLATDQALGPSWCSGSPGIALAVADSPAAAKDPELDAFVRRTAEAVSARGPLPNGSLCHGETGVLELFAKLPGASSGQTRHSRARALLAGLDRTGPRCGTPGALPAPGLLTGLSGIGHGLLRLGFAEHTASALLLQPPISGRPPWTPFPPMERNSVPDACPDVDPPVEAAQHATGGHGR